MLEFLDVWGHTPDVWGHTPNFPIPLPDKKVARRFGELVEKFYAWCECALKETESLISLRDFLLPLLMNGQVKVG